MMNAVTRDHSPVAVVALDSDGQEQGCGRYIHDTVLSVCVDFAGKR